MQCGRNVPLDPCDAEAVIGFSKDQGIGLVVIGPEAPLVAGVADAVRAAGIPVFGPNADAARLEGSKSFSKEFMIRHGLPTARYRACDCEADALAFVRETGAPIVVKADGLAAGKGVVVADDLEEAEEAVHDCFAGAFGTAGSSVVIEECLAGPECSMLAFITDGEAVCMPCAQDHKRAFDGDRGPNTGGMGAYSPAPVITPDIHARALREIILPTIRGMADEGTPFTGFLYAGLMIGRDGSLNTLEFNCRLGDPETQAILSRLKTPLGQLIQAGIDGRLDQVEAEWDRRSALCVVLAAAGYPAHPELGDAITGHPAHGNAEGGDLFVYHAGTAQKDQDVVTSGGRVLGVTGLGDSLKMAQTRAYEGVRGIHFNGMQYRSDIGHLGLPANQRHS